MSACMLRRLATGLLLVLLCGLLPGSPAPASALRSPFARQGMPRAAAAGGDPTATLITALLAATSWNELYVAHTDLSTTKADLSGSADDLVAPGSEPTYSATGGGTGIPGVVFAGSHKLHNTSPVDANGTRIGMIECGIWDTDASDICGLGGDFSSDPVIFVGGNDHAQAQLNFDGADDGTITDGSVHCIAIWQKAAATDAEIDGVVFSSDLPGNSVLSSGSYTRIRWGGAAFSDGTGTGIMFGILTDPDATKISAIESALATYLGITFS